MTKHYRLVTVVVLCPSVDDFLGVVSWIPKGKKTVGQYIASWADPEKNWTTYELSKHFSSREQGKRPIKCLNLAQEKILIRKF